MRIDLLTIVMLVVSVAVLVAMVFITTTESLEASPALSASPVHITAVPKPAQPPKPPITPTPVPTPALPIKWMPLDIIPLDADLQRHIYDTCEVYGVDMALVLGMIECESTFYLEAQNTKCWGLMQIHKVNYEWLRETGIEPLEYTGNIEAGVLMISRLLDKYGDTHKALMAYNCGESGAGDLWEQEYRTSSYSRAVIQSAEYWQTILQP